MAIREFECPHCWYRTERIEFTPDPQAPICPRCDAEIDKVIEMEKVISVPATAKFVGDGWTRPATYHMPQRGPNGD